VSLYRVESWREGVFVTAKVVPNINVARVYMAQQEARGFHVLPVHTRTESERAA